jgi:hypothetical protein
MPTLVYISHLPIPFLVANVAKSSFGQLTAVSGQGPPKLALALIMEIRRIWREGVSIRSW